MSSEELIGLVSAACFLVGATAALVAVYLCLCRLQKFAAPRDAVQRPGTAFDVSSVSPRVRDVRRDYLAAHLSPSRPHPKALLEAARKAVARLSYFCQTRS